MYIISKNKDYYDGVVGSVGMDKTIVYERNRNEITSDNMPRQFKNNRFSWNENNPFLRVCNVEIDKQKNKKYYKARGFIVGFCGNLHVGWKLNYKENEMNNETGFVQEVTKTDIIYGYKEAKRTLKTTYWNSKLLDDFKYVINYNSIDLFREYKSPIFVFDTDTMKDNILIINAILKEYEFYKVIDSFSAFQEIQMFIGGVLGTGEKEIIEIENKYKIGQHGFNKWSFRRESNKKK